MRTLRPLLAAAALCVSLCAPAGAVTDAADGFSVTPPSGWKPVRLPGITLIYRAPDVHGGFSSNVSVLVQPLPGPMTLAQYTALSQRQLGELVTNIHGQSERDVKMGGLSGHELRYSGTQGQFQLAYESAYVLRGGKAYLVTGTALETRGAELARFMDGVVQSFRFTR